MNSCLKLYTKHHNFLFDPKGTFNAFNLVRLLDKYRDCNEFSIDVSLLSPDEQSLILSKAEKFLRLYEGLFPNKERLISITFDNVSQPIIDSVLLETGGILDEQTLIFELSQLPRVTEDILDSHSVKNVRGAVLLSLVQDLLHLNKVEGSLSFFDEKSPLTLHSASSFLYNKDNAQMMWDVLRSWELRHDSSYKAVINPKLQQCMASKKQLKHLTTSADFRPSTKDSDFSHFVSLLQTKIEFPTDLYRTADCLQIWFVDDQHANGWKRLMDQMLSDLNVDLKPFTSLEDVETSIELAQKYNPDSIPDMALVDLRLSADDVTFEHYDSEDLSGFEVVDLLLNTWPGLPVVIASASNKLWNVEKAIRKGAVGYWRKSDEIHDTVDQQAIITALDIYAQFIEKITLALRKVKYRHVFRLAELLKKLCQQRPLLSTTLQRSVHNYCEQTPRTVSWMLWQNLDEIKVRDSIFLGIMELFNEIETFLWDENTGKLTLFPNEKVKYDKNDRIIGVINKTLDSIDSLYTMTGRALNSRYESCKKVRNNLPIIHGSNNDGSAKHASISDIEEALLIVWALMNQLSKNKLN
jgi:CheY-like chemotaxis protein